MRFGDFYSQPQAVPFGLPQGSPASPVLFLLFTAPLFINQDNRLGYVDDVCSLSTGRSAAEAINGAEAAAAQVENWCSDNGLQLSSSKFEVQHFHRGRQSTSSPVTLQGQPVLPNLVTRWLGVFLDTRLSFRHHVQHWSSKAISACSHLRRLNSTIRGAPPAIPRNAVLASCLPILTYGASIWWRGTHYLSRGKSVSSCALRLTEYISKAQRAILLSFLPAYKTSPLSALLREGFIPPAVVALEHIRLQSAVRFARLDHLHPIAQRLKSRFNTRLVQKGRSLPPIKRPHFPSQRHDTSSRSAAPCIKSPESIAAANAMIANIPRMDIVVYSDGSKLDNLCVGAGAFVLQAGITVSKLAIPLSKNSEVFDAEIAGAWAGLSAAVDSPGARFATDIYVLLDNKAAADTLLDSTLPHSSQTNVIAFRKSAKQWASDHAGCVHVRWIPGHAGITGNEIADLLAKEACSLTPTSDAFTFAAIKSLAKRKVRDLWVKWWDDCAPLPYKDLGIPLPSLPPKELQLNRQAYSYLVQCRTKHGDFAEYHTRFKHSDAEIMCACKSPKSFIHFAACPEARKATGINLTKKAPFLLGTPDGALRFASLLKESKFLTELAAPKFSH